jgi:hypothetical protein
MLKDSAFSEHEEGPALREVPLAQEMAVFLVLCGFEAAPKREQRTGFCRETTIYLIHGHKAWKVTETFRRKSQIGGVKKPRSLRLPSLLGFRYLTWIE